jgi:dihydroorotate dehydrogenase electron transfer subunit
MGELRAVDICERIDECLNTVTLKFRDAKCSNAKPGQFVMVWVPDYGEIPLSLSYIGEESGITIKGVGRATRALLNLEKGKIGIRGPYGNHFRPASKTLGIAGGIGIAPLISLKLDALVIGGKRKEEMPLRILREMGSKDTRVEPITEDGSLGEIGLASELGLELSHGYDLIVACGPEEMLHHLQQNLDREAQFSLERLMRCGIGLCGSCAIGKYRVCADGPIFTSSELKEVGEEFGICKRSSSGRLIPLEEHY